MKQLKCEMCGNIDLVKMDGLWVCQFCGAKYTIEEARKLLVDGVVDVSGSTVKIDNTDSIENYYIMAENACASGNYSEAENYCNKIIETNPKYYKAWLLKGKAAGWQSTLANIRIDEVINCFIKALENAPDDEIGGMKEMASREVKRICLAVIVLCCDNYRRWPSEEQVNEIRNKISLGLNYYGTVIKSWGGSLEEFKKEAAVKINECAVFTWKDVILKDYTSEPNPSEFVWNTFKERAFSDINVFQISADLSDENLAGKYKSMIVVYTEIYHSGAYTYDAGFNKYMKTIVPAKSAKKFISDQVNELAQKIKRIEPDYQAPKLGTKKELVLGIVIVYLLSVVLFCIMNLFPLGIVWNIGIPLLVLIIGIYVIFRIDKKRK